MCIIFLDKLIFYILNIGFVIAGIMTAEYMVKFLEQLKYPLTHLHNAADVTSFMNNHDVSLSLLQVCVWNNSRSILHSSIFQMFDFKITKHSEIEYGIEVHHDEVVILF